MGVTLNRSLWSRRRFVQATALSAQYAGVRQLLGATADGSIFDRAGAEYVRFEAGTFRMGEDQRLPLSMCEPLAYMTRGELQTMFPHGDPARLVLSDVLFEDGDPDEKPVAATRIRTPFYLGATQVTNLEYERFDPLHRKLRGKFGFSKADDEAVIYVSWQEAEAYCRWLAEREGKPFRLPTEAEWEYAARAGTTTLFSTGDTLPEFYLKNAAVTDFTAAKDKVSLRVGQTPPNPKGLYDVHGNVEEWVQDWYAPYVGDRAAGGPGQGTFKVTRGGSHGTFAYYLRSANRSAALPETRGFTIGFRVACGERAHGDAGAPAEVIRADVKRRSLAAVKKGPDATQPYFRGPRQFVKIAKDAKGPLYHYHNHDTGLAECPNGDLLAIWYTCAREQGRELSVAASRLEFGAEEWGEAYSFYDTPDRNDHCPALWFDGDETMVHLNGTALSHFWEPLQIVLRTSKDSGRTWSTPRYIAPDFGLRNMVCQPIVRLRNGWWIFGADAHPESSAMWLSKDQGATWEVTEGSINGIHAAIVELKDGRIMALGRGGNVDHHLPMSITDDYGKTWKAQATELPPITYTQRFSMTRLAEGHLALATFLPDVAKLSGQQATDRELAKLCICISYDDGKTWPVRRILTDERGDHGVTGMSYGRIYMGPGNGEPTAYVTITQARNGVIHVVSSMNHYAFNLKWAESGPKDPSPMPGVKKLVSKGALAVSIGAEEMTRYRVARALWSNERTGAMEALDVEKGFTAEAKVRLGEKEDDAFVLRAFARSGCTMCNRYWLRVTRKGTAYWYAGGWKALEDAAPMTAGGTYRMAVREDTCVQIYRDGRLLAVYPPSYEIGFAPPTRGNWLEWEMDVQGGDIGVPAIFYDLAGSFEPAAEAIRIER
jgi:formylglycine-generating enzyme required for sulfatase activity